jgi:hypothetical protein
MAVYHLVDFVIRAPIKGLRRVDWVGRLCGRAQQPFARAEWRIWLWESSVDPAE